MEAGGTVGAAVGTAAAGRGGADAPEAGAGGGGDDGPEADGPAEPGDDDDVPVDALVFVGAAETGAEAGAADVPAELEAATAIVRSTLAVEVGTNDAEFDVETAPLAVT